MFTTHDAIYTEEYYLRDVEGPASQAAPHIARSIVEVFAPNTLIDVGCGTGAMMAALRDLGVRVSGLEYAAAGIRLCQQRGLDVRKFDIENDMQPARETYDCAMSLEVAEHIPKRAAGRFVDLLCGLSDVVICSAARPGQPGVDHVNLKPKSYWVEHFRQRGFALSGVTEVLSSRWQSAGIADFYHGNLMVFCRTSSQGQS